LLLQVSVDCQGEVKFPVGGSDLLRFQRQRRNPAAGWIDNLRGARAMCWEGTELTALAAAIATVVIDPEKRMGMMIAARDGRVLHAAKMPANAEWHEPECRSLTHISEPKPWSGHGTRTL
jgi:hypothetical protein